VSNVRIKKKLIIHHHQIDHIQTLTDSKLY